MHCKCVSINIVTLLLADYQNGTLDSINSMHPPLPTHVHTNTLACTPHAQV